MTFPSRNEQIVLEILRDAPTGLYGLEIVDESGGRLKRGSVYVTLGRMAQKGFVSQRVMETERAVPGLPRPTYSITPLGARALQAAAIISGERSPSPQEADIGRPIEAGGPLQSPA